MALPSEQLEKSQHFKFKPGIKKLFKTLFNRRIRRKLKLNPESHPENKQYNGWSN